ncbi:hypothetical protein [Sodalis ligni]|uniref:Uncharacterized protein n=1 Tax=Sodalis ligni TaxID=2697027 RepID=A0A4R1NII2_9GAMM|nr:hypothetical protein [Sodalis ligni]TCL06907.1 hypothetical protein EZJ58_5205 [Sodalis ligni]
MNEQLVNELIAALKAETEAKIAQTEAINRLAESNEALCGVIIESLADDADDEKSGSANYLSGKPRG